MKFGISNLSIVPLRAEPNEKSEMCTHVLFGEHYLLLEENVKWCKVRLAFDQYEGWIDKKMITEISAEEFDRLNEKPGIVTTNIFNLVQPSGGYKNFLIVAGSSLPDFDPEERTFRIGEITYRLQGNNFSPAEPNNLREVIIERALSYFNSPYLWGGRSPFGIDCSGFSQILYKMAGISLPRNASEQSLTGDYLSFLEETRPGDLAFFDNEDGQIIHVGILWEKNKIIHASGMVRIDNVDQFGIYNVDTRRYSHKYD
jgi:hypothetical protein